MGAVPCQGMRPFLWEGGPLWPIMRFRGNVPGAEGEAWGSPSYQESSTKPSLAVNRYQRTCPKQAATPACPQGSGHHLLGLWPCCSWGRKAGNLGGPSVDARECGGPLDKLAAKEAQLTKYGPLAYLPSHPRGNGCRSLPSYAPIPLGRWPSLANACLGARPSGRGGMGQPQLPGKLNKTILGSEQIPENISQASGNTSMPPGPGFGASPPLAVFLLGQKSWKSGRSVGGCQGMWRSHSPPFAGQGSTAH